jgi:hypothetical protein
MVSTGAQFMIRWLLAFLIAATVLFQAPGKVFASDNPDLLPDHPTPVIDLAKALTDQQKLALEQNLEAFEGYSGWKLRVLTQYDRTPGLAVKEFWQLDERSLLLVADPRGGNLLNFNVGDALFALLPRTYWVELQTRFGNQYYVREHGEDGAIVDALAAVQTCLERGGCQVVPGLPREQWLLTLSTSILGGLVAGVASYPRKEGIIISWPWLLLFSPLWILLFGVLGLGPVITRTGDWIPITTNICGFLTSAMIARIVAKLTLPKPDSSATIN